MTRAFVWIVFLAISSSLAISSNAVFGQSNVSQSASASSAAAQTASFDIADVHKSPHHTFPFMSGGTLNGDRYIIRQATMVDLINAAYGVEDDNISGGPAWLETDRFDVIAKAPPTTSPDTLKLMLQAMLADRFKLVVHTDSKPVQAYVLSLGKGKPKLQESASSGEPDCQPQQQGPPAPGAIRQILLTCHGMTMDQLATGLLHDGAGDYLTSPVVNTTGLPGSWDFDIKWTPRGLLAQAGDDGISIFDAVDRQLGLKLELGKVPMPVLVVASANEKPTDNSPDVAKILPPPPPAEFDVAVIKPSDPSHTETQGRISGGQLNLQGATLKLLVDFAWDLNPNDDEMLVGAPKWLDSNRYDIVAKAAIEPPANGQKGAPQIDQDDLREMVRSLLIDRFKMQAHLEDRPISAYTLLADKPKLTKGDPSNRTRCKEGPGPDGKDPRNGNPALGRLLSCQNMTMAEFAEQLQSLASGYIYVPVKDATGLQGGWDFTLYFSTAGQLQPGPGGRGGAAAPPGAQNGASDPTGALSLIDAVNKELGLKLEKQTRPAPVLVIEHIEEKPTDN